MEKRKLGSRNLIFILPNPREREREKDGIEKKTEEKDERRRKPFRNSK